MVQVKKTPLRKCIGCQEMKPKKELFRVVKNKENEIAIDFTNKKVGRGAYICDSLDCFTKARKTRGLERAFSCKIPDDIYIEMETALKSRAVALDKTEQESHDAGDEHHIKGGAHG